MGQNPQPSKNQTQITIQNISQLIKDIFDDVNTIKLSQKQLSQILQLIIKDLQINLPIFKHDQGFLINPHMLQIFYHKNFQPILAKLINKLIQKLEDIMTQSIWRVKRQEYKYCLNIANFVLFFSDNKLIKMVETLNVRNDLHPDTKTFINQYIDEDMFQVRQNLIDKFMLGEIERIQKCIRISLSQMIQMKMQIQPRSRATLTVINKLENACFMIYMKAMLSPEHSKALVAKGKQEFLKMNIKIGNYFIGKGANQSLASIYQSSVLLFHLILPCNSSCHKQFRSLPSHLFHSLPIITKNTVYDFIINICLFTLTYVKSGSNVFYSRLCINRLMTLKLIDLIIKTIRVTSGQITYYLQDICMQTKVGQIERSFVIGLVQLYCNLVNETIHYQRRIKQEKENKGRKSKQQMKQKVQIKQMKQKVQINKQSQQSHAQKPSYRFCHQHHPSSILTTYLQNGKQNYQIKFSNKKFAISTIDIITQLQNDQNMLQNQFLIISQKFIYEGILQKKVQYQYNDRQIWNQILPNIIGDREDNEMKDEDDEMHTVYQDDKEGNKIGNNMGNGSKMGSMNQIVNKGEQAKVNDRQQQQQKQPVQFQIPSYRMQNKIASDNKLHINQSLKINFHQNQSEQQKKKIKSQQVSVVNIQLQEDQEQKSNQEVIQDVDIEDNNIDEVNGQNIKDQDNKMQGEKEKQSTHQIAQGKQQIENKQESENDDIDYEEEDSNKFQNNEENQDNQKAQK